MIALRDEMTVPVQQGDVLAGKYRVERVLGSGGMGVVVAAAHLTLGERVAIKFLLPSALTQPELVQRFQREGQSAARIKSEHVGRVFDVGTLESGAPYLVMEYLDGSDLGTFVREQGPVEVPLAVDFVLQTCEAIAEAHALGMVHRDLKPANLFLTYRADGSPCVKVIDFGISKAGGFGGDAVDMTKSAVMMGSPLFMAPEQMASAKDADARSDIWSLGVILHVLIAGRPPFEGETALGIYDKMLLGAPPLRTLRIGVPEGLEAAVLRCLKKDRDARFRNVAELAVALAPYAPPGAKLSVDRVVRVLAPTLDPESLAALRGAGGPQSTTGGGGVSVHVTRTDAPEIVALGHTEIAAGTTDDVAARSGTGRTAMGQSVAVRTRKPGGPALALGLGLGVVALGAGLWMLREREPAPAPLPAASAVLVAPQPSAAVGSELTVSPAPEPSALPTATPSASASAVASASAPPKPLPKGTTSAKPRSTSTPPSSTQPTADPFADPR